MKVKFIAKDEDARACVEGPVLARTVIPNWFKDMPRSIDSVGTAKVCTPFVDAFVTGYIQRLWCDIEFYNDGTKVNFESKYPPVTVGKISPKHVPIFDGYGDIELQWNTHWEPVTDEGYSTLYTHPINQYNLPFMTFGGIIDTDNFSLTGPLRFLLKKGFNGIIKKGTPIYQIIPFKRDNWEAPNYDYDYESLREQNEKLDNYKFNHQSGGYKKLFWQKKRI